MLVHNPVGLVLALVIAACGAAADYEDVTPAQAAELIAAEQGRVVLLELYLTTCPHCANQLAILQGLAPDYADLPVTFLGFALDQDGDAVGRYAGKHELPFAARRLVDYSISNLRLALQPHGVDINERLAVPFIAIIGPDGVATVQYQGTTSDTLLRAAINSALP